jgi:hypothetical protein
MRETAWLWQVIQAGRWMAEVADDVEDLETVLSAAVLLHDNGQSTGHDVGCRTPSQSRSWLELHPA